MCCREQVELKSLFCVIKPAPLFSMLSLAFLTGVHQYYFCHPCQFSPIMSALYHSAEILTCRATLLLFTAQCMSHKNKCYIQTWPPFFDVQVTVHCDKFL